jgi:hypothetical protein
MNNFTQQNKIHNLNLFIYLVLISFIFTACPYESSVPIDAPSIKIDPALFGVWADIKAQDTYKISRHNDYVYDIVQMKNLALIDTLHSFHSMVNGIPFLNFIDNIDDESKTYLFYKMNKINDETIILSEVTDNIDERFTSSSELKQFISDNMKYSFFFNKEETKFKRISR